MPKIRIEPDTVAILLTDQCTAKCSMCCFSCSPEKRRVFEIETIKNIIDQAAVLNGIKTVGFSGGEVFLQYNLLANMVKYASELGLRTTCTSNGFWGTSYEVALEKLLQLKKNGLSKLGLSVDRFHQQYVDINNIKNILMACKKIGLPVDVGSVVTKSTSDLSDAMVVLKDELINITHIRAACLPIGEAENINSDDLYYDEDILKRDNILCYDTTFFSIYLNGDVYPCCSQAGKSSCLKLGNIHTDNLEGILKKYRSNMYIRIIKKYGLSWFVKIALKEGLENIYTKNYVNKCHLCYSMFNNEEFIKCAEKYVREEKAAIYQKYLDSQNNGINAHDQ